MKRLFSISVLLQTATIVMTLAIAAVCGVYALSALRNQEQARRVPQVLELSNNLYAALGAIRAERGRAFRLVASSRFATRADNAELDRMRAASDKILTATLAELAVLAFDQRDKSVTEIRDARIGFEALRQQLDATLKMPLEDRPADLTERWAATYNRLADAIDQVSNRLENELTVTDAVVAGLVRIKQVAWSLRTEIGRDRVRVATAIAKGQSPDGDFRLELATIAGRIDGQWKILKDRVALSDIPPQLKESVAKAEKLYFGETRAAHDAALADLADGRTTSPQIKKWLQLVNPALDSVFAIGQVALDSAGVYARAQFSIAQREFYAAILLMSCFCIIGVLTSLYVVFGVVRPMTRVTEAMRLITDGNLTSHIPYKNRGDEIGSLAHGLRVFRDNALEKQRLRIEKDGAVAASRAKSEFLANVSHELRTPLNAIIGFSEVMKTELFGPVSERYRGYSTDIYNSGTHLLGLINEILDLSKAEAGQLELREEVVDIAATVEACVNLIREPARKAGVHLSVYLDYDVPFLLADERRMRQILINLLSNAVKFTPEDGEVTVATVRVPDGLAIEVRDTGIGIAPEDIPKALTPFGQVDSKISRKYEGTGLGLPLVKHLAELHGGSLSIASEVNVGTTVTVLLPGLRIVRVAQPLRA